jgi:hypothetical protein
LLHCLTVNIGGVAAREGKVATTVWRWFPGDGLVDTEVVEYLAGMVVECDPQWGGHRVGELVIAGKV